MVFVKKIAILQYIAAISASITSLGLASAVAWSSSAIPYFTNKSENRFSKIEIYWIVPLLSIGCIIGFSINPFINKRLGNKRTLLLYSIPQLVSWALLIFLENRIIIIYISRLLSGMGFGAGCCAQTIYLSEIGNQDNRGIFIVISKLTMSVGFFLTVLVGAYCSHYTMNLFLLMMPVTFLFTFIFMPDSTYFLKKNQEFKRESKLRNSRGVKQKILNEEDADSVNLEEAKKIMDEEKKKEEARVMIKVEKNIETEKMINTEKVMEVEKITKFNLKVQEKTNNRDNKLIKLFTVSNNRRAFIIIILFAAQNIFSGFTITRYFAQNLLTFEESPLPAEKSVLLLAAFSIFNSLISTFIIEKFKRKSIFISFCSLATISLGSVGVFFYLKKNNYIVSGFNWFPLFGLIVYDFAITSGNYNINLIYLGELLSNDVKGIGITLSRVILMLMSFSASLIFQILFDIFHISLIFWGFALSCFILTLIIYKITPETKGKSLEEIQRLLKSKS